MEGPEDRALDGPTGYPSGPDATVEATAAALERVDGARTLVLVEGVSDLIAVEALARRREIDLELRNVVVVPMGGAQAISRFLSEFGPGGPRSRRLVGLCDAGEEAHVRRAIDRSGLGTAADRTKLRELGFFVCDADLEDELIRSCGAATVEDVLAVHGDLPSFRTLQRQAAWHDRPVDRQLHRWLRAGASRRQRYSAHLVEAAPADRLPGPLNALLDAALAG